MKWALFGGECSPCNTVHHGKKYTNLACFESRFCSRAAALEFSIYTNNRSVSRNCFDALQKHCSVVGKITSPLTYMLVILLHNLCCFRSYCFCRSRPGCLKCFRQHGGHVQNKTLLGIPLPRSVEASPGSHFAIHAKARVIREA